MRIVISTLLTAFTILAVPVAAMASGPRPCDIDGTPCDVPEPVVSSERSQPASAPAPARGGGSCVAPCVATNVTAGTNTVSYDAVHPTPTSEAAASENTVAAEDAPTPEPTVEPTSSPVTGAATEPPSDDTDGSNWPLVAGLLLSGGVVIKLASFLA